MTIAGEEEAFFKAKIFLQRSMKYFPYCHFSLIIFMLDLWMKAGQSKNAKNSSVSDVRKVYTLLQNSLSCKLRIWIDLGKNHGTQINCIYKIIARVFFFISTSTTNATLFIKIWFIIFDHFSSIFSIQLKKKSEIQFKN